MRAALLGLAGIAGMACMIGLPGCVDDGGDDEAAEGSCVPNESVACLCTEGLTGAQVCDAQGSGFGECSCEGGTESGTDTTDTGADTSDWDGQSVPSWSKHIVPLFYGSCGAGINGCHSREAYAAAVDSDCRGWLSLEDVALGAEFYSGPDVGTPTGCPDTPLHDRLVSLAPWQCAADSQYVAPGSTDNSYLWKKIQGQNLCEVSPGVGSDPMPPPDSGITLTDTDKQMIEAWILAGAPNGN